MNDYKFANDQAAPAVDQPASDVIADTRQSLLDAISILDMWEGRPSQPEGNITSAPGGIVSLAFSTRSVAYELRERLQGLRNRIGNL